MKTPRTTIAVLLAACAISVSLAWAQDHSGHKGPAPSAAAKPKVKPYPLATCVVSGEKLGGDMGEPHVFIHEGQEVKLCCKSCLKDFQKDTPKHMAKIVEAAKKVKPYPLTTCVVSGEKLGGGMEEPYVFVHEGQEIKLCCKSCLKDFQKDPAKFAKKIAAAGPKAKP